MRNVVIPRDAWELDRLPEHLTVTFRVLDERGREVARGTDLEKLRHELAPKVREELATAGAGIEATGLTTWSIGTLPREIGVRRGPHVAHRLPRAWSTAGRRWTSGSSPPRPSATRRTAAASGGCCSSRRRRRPAR